MQIDDILEKVRSYSPDARLDVVQKAYEVAESCHQGQRRRSGEPYLIHPLAVAAILADLKLDIECIAVGLLHDVIEDTLITFEEVKRLFNQDIADMVDGLSKLSKMSFASREEAQAENFRKMLFAISKDIRVILVKLADRLHNMRTLEHMTEEQKRRIAQETLDIYAPIANRLGIQRIKIELEDLGFAHLHPETYHQIQESLEENQEKRHEYMEKVRRLLLDAMQENQLECEVAGRVKHLYSIYKKMVRNQVEFSQIYDLTAFRILVDNVGQCYQALGVVHAMYRPINDRFKDYIAVPKPNGYQSLHTTVIGPEGVHIEVQIRTRTMHRVAESGIAAHWKYKEGRLALSAEELERVARLRQLYEWAHELKDPKEFMLSVKEDLFAEEIYIFTPKGDVKDFPDGSTPLDFAFSIHTEVGLHCSGARVNGRIVPFSYKLRNGDRVEILTHPSARPSDGWLSLAATGRARNKIRAFLRQEERERNRVLGKEVLEREFKRASLNYNKLSKEPEFKKLLEELHLRSEEELFVAVGGGRLPVERLTTYYAPPEPPPKKDSNVVVLVTKTADRTPVRKSSTPIKIRGEGDILVNFAGCCSPLHGDAVVGIITLGHGITVHLITCNNVLNVPEERHIEVSWDADSRSPRKVRIKVLCADRAGMLVAMSKVIATEGVNITLAECRAIEDKKAINIFELTVPDRRTLEGVMKALERIRGVISVERLSGKGAS